MKSSFKQNLNTEEKIIYLKTLFYATICKIIDDSEYILAQAKEMGITLRELRKIKKPQKPESISNELLNIKDLKLRHYFIREMISLAIIDHEISDEEMCLIYKIGSAIGVKEEKINDFFLWAAAGVEWQIEGERLVEDCF